VLPQQKKKKKTSLSSPTLGLDFFHVLLEQEHNCTPLNTLPRTRRFNSRGSCKRIRFLLYLVERWKKKTQQIFQRKNPETSPQTPKKKKNGRS
jgi:hypothetical protein